MVVVQKAIVTKPIGKISLTILISIISFDPNCYFTENLLSPTTYKRLLDYRLALLGQAKF